MDNTVCGDCTSKVAEYFCTCTDPLTYLCAEHQLKHTSQRTAKGHRIWSILQLPVYNNLRYQAFLEVSEEVKGCIRQVERASEELTAKVDELKAFLTRFCAEKVRELQEIKVSLARDIAMGLEEVERTLAEEQPHLITLYGPLIRDRTEKGDSLQLFDFTIEASSPPAILSFTSQLASPQDLLQPTSLAGVFNDRISLYEISSEQFTRRTLSINFGDGGSYVQLNRSRLLCIGAQPASSSVHLLELPSFQLSLLCVLSTARRNAGIAKVGNCVYVFGGDNGQMCLNSCEKVVLLSKCCAALQSMTHTRSAFTPCLFRSLLYLAAATDRVRAVETFSPETETFTVLPVSLPPQLALGRCSVAFVFNEELCLLTQGKQMARWKIGVEREFRLFNTGKVIWSNQQPLIVDSIVLIAHGGGVKQFSLQTYSELKYVN